MSDHKSEKVKDAAIEKGWEVQIVTKLDAFEMTQDVNDIEWHLYAMRNKEEYLHVIWIGDKMESGFYTYRNYRRKLWWRTEVIKVINSTPDPTKMRGLCKKYSDEEIPNVRNVPWDDDTPAVDIMLAVINRTVKWIRKFDNEICEQLVDVNLGEKASAKHFRVYSTNAGRRVLEWADALGFHAVGIDQIISVE